ncbi:hypothetical protein KFE25_011891 [Diacronema lutheri]|uniref:Uncharacterized protein n=1 Tax=Diacronema lutheri TaxID=2081491 RepID=A0A8J6C870_DIALT|nr:hypothetical protein KFE25_011891 [Diacronema lutheri]
MDEVTSVWEEVQLVLVDLEIVELTSARARAEFEVHGCRLVEYADGRPGKGSLVSNNCIHLFPPEPTELPSPLLLKAQSRADYALLVGALKRALAACADNAVLKSLEAIIVAAETARAEALLQASSAMLAAATAAPVSPPATPPRPRAPASAGASANGGARAASGAPGAAVRGRLVG